MPQPTPLVMFLVFLGICFTEFFVFYASTALGNVEVNFGKWVAGAIVAALPWAGVFLGGWVILNALGSPLEAEHRLTSIAIASAGLVLGWMVPALLFVPVLPVSVPRGMLVSIFQLLLRLFLYVLITAIVMVVLALLQIWYGGTPEKRSGQSPTASIVKTA